MCVDASAHPIFLLKNERGNSFDPNINNGGGDGGGFLLIIPRGGLTFSKGEEGKEEEGTAKEDWLGKVGFWGMKTNILLDANI
jgi:hypothetical protein